MAGNQNSRCPICGEPTYLVYGKYPRKDKLCGPCSKKQIKQDSEKVEEPKERVAVEPTSTESELTCIICGEPSNGKHFCIKCYHKYKERSVDIRIVNCKDTEILDAYGNLQYKCDDGRKVRSKSEKIISDFLFKYGIRTIYEKTVYYYPNENETITLHPDFYLPDKDFYIEHNGVDTQSYKANKAKTEEMYKSLGYKVIVTTEADLGDIEAKLKPILRIN